MMMLSSPTDLVLAILGAKGKTVPGVTEEENHAILSDGSDAGLIEYHEHAMVRNVFPLDHRLIVAWR